MSILNNENTLTKLPTLRDSSPVVYTTPNDIVCDGVNVSGITIDRSKESNENFKFGPFKRDFRLVAHKFAAELVKMDIGRSLVIAKHNIKVVNGATRPADRLNLKPAVAAAASAIADRNFTSAIAAVNSMFATQTGDRVEATRSSVIRALSKELVDPTRICVKFAQLYWYCVFMESQNEPKNITALTVPAVHIKTISHIKALLTNGKSGDNYLPIDLDKLEGDAVIAMSIMRYISADGPIPTSNKVSLPSVLTTHIPLRGDLRPIYVGDESIVSVDLGFTQYDVWLTMFTWASQFDVIDLMHECIDSLATMFYSNDGKCDPMFHCQDVRWEIPPLRTAHYALFPLAVAADTLIGTDVPNDEEPFEIIKMSVIRGQVLSAGYRDVLWGLGVNADCNSPRHQAKLGRWLQRLHTPIKGGSAPVIGICTKYASQLGVNIGHSLLSMSIYPASTQRNVRCFNIAREKCTEWSELIDVLQCLPDATLDAVVNLKTSKNLLQPNTFYNLDNVINGSLPSVVAALVAARASFYRLIRKRGTLNWIQKPITYEKGLFCEVSNTPFAKYSADDSYDNKIVFTLPDPSSSMLLQHGNDMLKDATWYIVGTRDKPLMYGPDITGDDPFGVPPSGGNAPDYNSDDDDSSHHDNDSDSSNNGGDGGGGVSIKKPPEDDDNRNQDIERDDLSDTSSEKLMAKLRQIRPDPSKRQQLPLSDRIKADVVGEVFQPGVCTAVKDTWLDLREMQNRVDADTLSDYFTPILNTIGAQLNEVSFPKLMIGSKKARRAGAASNLSRMLRDLAVHSKASETQRNIAQASVRLANVGAAMKVCPAVVMSEMAEEGQVYSPDIANFYDESNGALLEHGVSLRDICRPKSVGIDTIEISAHGTELITQHEMEGWKKTRKQEGVPLGKIRMYRPKQTAPMPDLGELQMGLFLQMEQTEQDTNALLKQLLPTAEDDELESVVSDVEESSSDDTPSSDPNVVELPPGQEQKAREESAAIAKYNAEMMARQVALESVESKLNVLRSARSDAQSDARKEHVNAQVLAVESLLDNNLSAAQIHDHMVELTAEFAKQDNVFNATHGRRTKVEKVDFRTPDATSESTSVGAAPYPGDTELHVDNASVPDDWEDRDDVSLGPPAEEQKSAAAQTSSNILTDQDVANIETAEFTDLG